MPETSDRGYISRMSGWATQPFSAQMDLWHWVMFAGLIIVAAFIWTRILNIIVEHVQ